MDRTGTVRGFGLGAVIGAAAMAIALRSIVHAQAGPIRWRCYSARELPNAEVAEGTSRARATENNLNQLAFTAPAGTTTFAGDVLCVVRN